MVKNQRQNATSSDLFGLVLSGGKSTRMGRDKGTIEYHGMPQREYLFEMLQSVCDQTFLSIRAEQQGGIGEAWQTIVDMDRYRGPLNGLLSAHEKYPEVAWLVLACDLPLITVGAIRQLISARRPEKDATAMATKSSGLPEPLVAIWEAGGLVKAKKYLEGSDSSCPRKFLLNSDTALVYPEDDQLLCNANSLAEYREVLTKLAT